MGLVSGEVAREADRWRLLTEIQARQYPKLQVGPIKRCPALHATMDTTINAKIDKITTEATYVESLALVSIFLLRCFLILM